MARRRPPPAPFIQQARLPGVNGSRQQVSHPRGLQEGHGANRRSRTVPGAGHHVSGHSPERQQLSRWGPPPCDEAALRVAGGGTRRSLHEASPDHGNGPSASSHSRAPLCQPKSPWQTTSLSSDVPSGECLPEQARSEMFEGSPMHPSAISGQDSAYGPDAYPWPPIT
jgi:hypothetical protein